MNNGPTYKFDEIHLADPGYEMQSLCHATQLVGHILTVASLGSIQDESLSIMSLALDTDSHVWQNAVF